MKLQYRLFVLICLLAMALAGCQKHEEQIDNDGEAQSAAPSNVVNDDNNENAIVLDDNNGDDYNPAIDPAKFVSVIDNPYLTLTPGRVWIYEGKDEDGEMERVQVEVTSDTKMVMGVAATVVRAREWKDGELAEDTFDWYAQDKDGNVWYFGEESKEIADNEIVSTAGSWEAGVDGAQPGIIMKANPQVGDAYRQEFLKGEAEDMGKVLSLSDSVNTVLGIYRDCLKVQDWTPLEPNVVEHKFYSKEIGNAVLEQKVAGESGGLQLIEMKSETVAK